jgi:hypothetical protein
MNIYYQFKETHSLAKNALQNDQNIMRNVRTEAVYAQAVYRTHCNKS